MLSNNNIISFLVPFALMSSLLAFHCGRSQLSHCNQNNLCPVNYTCVDRLCVLGEDDVLIDAQDDVLIDTYEPSRQDETNTETHYDVQD